MSQRYTLTMDDGRQYSWYDDRGLNIAASALLGRLRRMKLVPAWWMLRDVRYRIEERPLDDEPVTLIDGRTVTG